MGNDKLPVEAPPDFLLKLGKGKSHLAEKVAGNEAPDPRFMGKAAERKGMRMHIVEDGILLKNARWSAAVMDETVGAVGGVNKHGINGRITGIDQVQSPGRVRIWRFGRGMNSGRQGFQGIPAESKMIRQRGRMVGNAEGRDFRVALQAKSLSGRNWNIADPHLESFLLKPEKVQESAAEFDRLFGAVESDQALLEHQAVNQRWQAVDVVGVDVRHKDCAYLERAESKFFDFLDDAAGAVDQDEFLAGDV